MSGGRLDLLIKGSTVFDGTGAGPFRADIGIVEDKIFLIKEDIALYAEKIIDAAGLCSSPGFIDTHCHSDFTCLADLRAEGRLYQGVTTEVNGNCGLSAAPLYKDAARQREADLEELGIRERWSTFDEYFRVLGEKGLSINFAALAGHGNIKASVMGYEDRPPREEDMARMKNLLRDALNSGVIGLSTGLIYPPGAYSNTEELIELVKIPEMKDHIYTSHMRSEGNRLLEAVEEAIRIGEEGKVKVHISHIKTSGEKNWHKIENTLAMMDGARRGGLRLTCDRYPYTAASTDLDTVLPSWTYAGGTEEELRRLNDRDMREKIKAEMVSSIPHDNYWDGVSISNVSSDEMRWMEGRTISSISGELGMKPVDAVFHILISDRLRTGAIFRSMSEENLRRFLKVPYIMIGSDSSSRSGDGPTHKGKPHPRGFGTFPRFLGRYARDEALMDMASAIHKITALPCETFSIGERGLLKEGFMADIVIFNPDEIIDRATYEEPFAKSEGVYFVIVNGMPVMKEGRLTGLRPGRVLRHGK